LGGKKKIRGSRGQTSFKDEREELSLKKLEKKNATRPKLGKKWTKPHASPEKRTSFWDFWKGGNGKEEETWCNRTNRQEGKKKRGNHGVPKRRKEGAPEPGPRSILLPLMGGKKFWGGDTGNGKRAKKITTKKIGLCEGGGPWPGKKFLQQEVLSAGNSPGQIFFQEGVKQGKLGKKNGVPD